MIEPLESRIAPAAITLVAYNYNNEYVNPVTHQVLMQFYNAANPSLTGANLAIAKTVGLNPNVYFMKISSGEDLQTYNTGNGASNEVNVTAGTVVAFFTDSNPSNTATNPAIPTDPVSTTGPAVSPMDLTGLALGNKVSVGVGGNVYGDVVTNYNDLTGQLGGIAEVGGNATQLLNNTVINLSVAGITGAFVTGGIVESLNSTGLINQVFSGTAANANGGYTFHFAPTTLSSPDTTLSVPTPGNGIAGPSISNATLGSVNLIQLGTGGPGGAGGSINGLTLNADGLDASINAGAGGNGISGHINGGAGGTISNVLVLGPATATNPVPNAVITLNAGIGGNAFTGSSGRGGAGGSVGNVFVDYNKAGLTYASVTSLQDNIIVQGGNGGNGGYGGVGGSLSNINLLTSTPHAAGGTTAEIQLLGGTGGTGSVGYGGAGGSISNSYVNDSANLDNLLPIDPVTQLPYDTALSGPNVTTSTTLTEAYIHAGDGGVGVTIGGAGGSISGMTLEGYNYSLVAGNGQPGHVGGAGGAISTVTVLGSNGTLPGDDYHIQSLNIQTGHGGTGTELFGGKAGSLYALTVNNANFGLGGYDGLQIQTGRGGDSARGTGGAGGSIGLVHITGLDFLTDVNPQGSSGNATIIAGNGGNSPVAGGKGGAGGSIDNVTIVATRLNVQAITAGNGGNGGVNASTGTGGAGGTVTAVAVSVGEDLFVTNPSVTSASVGLLYDSNAAFGTNGVLVGDLVVNNTNQQTTTVTSVSANELGLTSDIFAAGDSYTVLVPGTNGMNPTPTKQLQGTDQEVPPGPPYSSPQDTIIDSSSNFNGVQVGDVVTDVTDTIAATLANGGIYTPITATVTGIANVATGILNVSNDISHVGDQYAFSTLGGVAATPTTILVDNTNFVSEGIPAGTIIEDVTATQAADTAAAQAGLPVPTPITATVATIAAHELTVTNPSSSTFGTVGDQYSFITLGQSHITGGNGGTGVLNGAGGAGGGVFDSTATTEGTAYFQGGNGGNGGANGFVGAGGSLTTDGAFSTYDSGSLIAGNAGLTGAKLGAGGSVTGAVVEVYNNVTLLAGFGTAGGAGGGITNSGYSGVLKSGGGFNPQIGNVLIQAGAGGTSGTGYGGAGGTISGVTGFISAGDGSAATPIFTEFIAGHGGDGTVKAGAGGSVDYIRFFGGGGAGVTFFINAGDAGNTTAATGKTGAAGGSVYKVGGGAFLSTSGNKNFSISPLTDFHHISAGNGGNGAVTGGVGGSVTDVFVNATIGVRSGDPFGFDIAGINGATVTGMGGISAGIGGTGGTKSGLAGNVEFIAADAIASIVAGRLGVGAALQKVNLANEVNDIILNGTNLLNLNHEFTLTFDNETTAQLPTNATPIQVASALNALAAMAPVADGGNGGVSVTESGGQYVVTFNVKGVQDTITGSEPSPSFTTEQVQGSLNVQEVQSVQVLAASPFTLTFDGVTTGVLNYTGNTTNDATAVQNALTPLVPGGVTVTATAATANTNPSFLVTFNDTGAQTLIVPNFQVSVVNSGSASTYDTETITLPSNSGVDLTQVNSANFVGSIVNPLRPNATTFSFTIPPSTTPVLSSNTPFQFGDAPIDGLIAALDLTSAKNFIPQAYVTADASGNAFLVNNLNG